jgi:hypothetical protein
VVTRLTKDEINQLIHSDGCWGDHHACALKHIEELESYIAVLEKWAREGEAIVMAKGTPMFLMGEWWADRPWRRKT